MLFVKLNAFTFPQSVAVQGSKRSSKSNCKSRPAVVSTSEVGDKANIQIGLTTSLNGANET